MVNGCYRYALLDADALQKLRRKKRLRNQVLCAVLTTQYISMNFELCTDVTVSAATLPETSGRMTPRQIVIKIVVKQ